LIRSLRRSLTATLVVSVLVLGAVVVGSVSRPPKTTEVDRAVPVNLTAMAKPDSKGLIDSCNRRVPYASLGLRVPTLVSRDGIDVAVLFADQTEYTLCVLSGSNNVSVNGPAVFTHTSNTIAELQSSGRLSKVKGRSLYATNMWFVVRVSPLVTTLKAVTSGASDVTSIRDGFALVHESGKVDVHVKGFSYGEAVGFGAGGALVGSAALN